MAKTSFTLSNSMTMTPLKHLRSRVNNRANATKHGHHVVRTNKTHVSTWDTFLRAIGLKVLLVRNRLGFGKNQNREEEEKVLVSTPRKIALIHSAVHLPSVIITIFLILWNTIEFLYGPQITASFTFALQLLAKIHELTISASLTVMMLDVVRYQLLHEGINLGLLTSSFSIMGLNFLWSPNLLSIFFTDYTWRKRLFLLGFIITCCVMTSVVGPASALLFVPTQVWKSYGWTNFNLGGTDERRWPRRLTIEHVGPPACRDPDRMLMMVCPAGGFNTLYPRLIRSPEVNFDIPIHDARYTRLIRVKTPWFNKNFTEQTTDETWVLTSRSDVTFMMQDLSYVHGGLKEIATGRRRRLRDFVDGGYMISESKIPVGRTVCGPPRVIDNGTKSLPFPILEPDHVWRNLSTISPNENWGPTKEHDVEDLNSFHARKNKVTQARTVWVPLGAEYGAATAGLVVISQNMYLTVGRACTLDFRWASGQVYVVSGSILGAFETEIGPKKRPTNSENQYHRLETGQFMDPRLAPHLGPTIKADKDWLDNIFPKYINTTEPDGYNMTTLEYMIDSTTASWPDYVISNETGISYGVLSQVEMIVAASFVDALARVGWVESLKFPDDSMMINPVLQQHASTDQQLILKGGAIYSTPTNMSFGVGTVNWYSYGVAWTLKENGQLLSVAVLGFHLVLVSIHVVLKVWKSRSMGAWDSITEILLLAWNSVPTRRDDELKNCSVGIHGIGPMEQKVKAMVIEEDDGTDGRVELVVVDNNAINKDRRKAESIKWDAKYR